MSSDFCQLCELANIQGGFAFKGADFEDVGVAVVKIANIRPPSVSLSGADRVPPEKLVGLDRFKLRDDDVLMAMTGATVGKVGRFKEVEPAYLNQRVARITAKNGSEYGDFIYAVVTQPGFDSLIEGVSAGSAQANISTAGIGSVWIPRLALDDQLAIGNIARTLDDRITLLRETNATLEAIAQALFKSWFVDFDPVRAKMEGRAPEGMDEDAAALFSDEFEESELGLVPKGWRVMPVGDAVEAVGGATPDTKNPAYWEPAVHCWTSPKDLSGIAAPVLLDTERKLSDQGLAKIGSGALPVGTLLLSSRAPIGYLALAQVPLAINQGYIAMLPGGLLPPLYMLFWCRQNMENIEGRANGSTFMEISKKAFRPIPALVPPPEIVLAFTAVAHALFDRLIENEKQAQTLTTLRDTLLPRLISGQLRLPEAQTAAEEALVSLCSAVKDSSPTNTQKASPVMIHRSTLDLHFASSRDPMPTVEIQVDSLEEQGLSFTSIISSALTRFAVENPTSKVTVYIYGTMSVNFHTAAWSEFFIPVGDKAKEVLKLLSSAFSRLPGVRSRISDHIAPSKGMKAFHVEDGLVWMPEDAVTWYSESTASVDEKPVSAVEPVEDDEINEDDPDEWGGVLVEAGLAAEEEEEEEEGDTPSGGRTPEQPARYRAARSDAKVARIRQRIEEVFGLPEGSVALCGPDGRALRGDALIKTLRNRWANS